MAIRRRSNMRARLNKLQGMPIDEKMMLLRMGEIIDGAINNRAPTNPNSDRGRPSTSVPVPTNLEALISTRGAVLSWNKVSFDSLLNYRVRISPIGGEGEELIATSFTNQFLFKGRAGTYIFEVQVITRSGKAGDFSSAINFTIYDTPMILEGNKLGVEELGAQLFETVLTPLNYTVFAFASVILDSLADPNNNPSVTLELRRGTTYNSSVFIQSFDLYPESEDLSNFDNTVGVTRPAGTPTRSGNFQTTQSVMFTPYQILEGTGIVDQNTTFWITATNHSSDIVGMSCAVWVASEGLSEEASPVSEPHTKSIQLPAGIAGDNNRALGALTIDCNEATIMQSTVWTFSVWIKPQDLSGSIRIKHFYEISPIFLTPQNENQRYVLWIGGTDTLEIRVEDGPGTTFMLWERIGSGTVWPLGVDNWHLLTVAFNGTRAGSKFDVYVNGAVISPTSDDSGAKTISDPISTTTVFGGLSICGRVNAAHTGVTEQIASQLLTGRIHQAGFWSVVLSSAAVSAIYNVGNGSVRDWRESFGAYGSQLDLIHYWRFGALLNDRDGSTGNILNWENRGGGFGLPGNEPTLADIAFNIANDVAFDLGTAPAFDYMDFTNRIQIPSTEGSDLRRESLGGARTRSGGISETDLVDSGDIVDDFPS